MKTKLKRLSAVAPAATCTGFFIVNVHDRPSAEHIAERLADGKYYYVHPGLRDVKHYWGMTPESPTPLEDFGIRWLIEGGMFRGKLVDPSRATYRDGRPQKWQDDAEFSFSFQNVRCAPTGAIEEMLK